MNVRPAARTLGEMQMASWHLTVIGLLAGCQTPVGAQDAAAVRGEAAATFADAAVDGDAPVSRDDAAWTLDAQAGDADVAVVKRDAVAAPEASTDVGPATAVTDAAPTVDPATVGSLRLLAPLSTSVVTSRRPTLRWGPMPAGSRTTVSLCDDPACARVLATLDTTSASARPTEALRPGPVFWHARVTDAAGAAWESPTWEFFVRHHDSPVDTSRCCVVDVNRDGVPDVESARLGQVGRPWIANHADWSASVFVSAADGYASTPWQPSLPERLGGPTCHPTAVRAYEESQIGLRCLSDVDGDGYGDVGIALRGLTTCNTVYEHMMIALVGGGASERTLRSGLMGFGAAALGLGGHPLLVQAAGDVDGDGYGDIGFSYHPPYIVSRGVRLGSAMGIGPGFDAVRDRFEGEWGAEAFGFDSDGDGRGDVAGWSIRDGVAGQRLFVATRAVTTTWSWPRIAFYGRDDGRLERVGDINGDGYEDLAVNLALWTTPPTDFTAILLGGSGGYTLERTLPFGLTWHPTGTGGPLLDVNSDGIADRFVARSAAPPALYFGSAEGFTRVAPLPRCTPAAPHDAAAPCGPYRHFSPGDFNRDGYDDLYVWSERDRTLEVFAGGLAGFSATPLYTTTLGP